MALSSSPRHRGSTGTACGRNSSDGTGVPVRGLHIPAIPEKPTKPQVAAALDAVEEIIGGFPFVDEASKANTLATMLISVMRPAIKGKTPLALIDAPQMGTGKDC
jgi:hypothetical protein